MILAVPNRHKNMEYCLIALFKVVVDELRCKQLDCNLSCFLFLNNHVLVLQLLNLQSVTGVCIEFLSSALK